jgi:hypothetical protein
LQPDTVLVKRNAIFSLSVLSVELHYLAIHQSIDNELRGKVTFLRGPIEQEIPQSRLEVLTAPKYNILGYNAL